MAWTRRRVDGLRSDERGVSLVEIMFAVMLFGMVVVVMGPVMISSLRSVTTAQNESRAIDEVRNAVARIDRELRSAECITSPVAGGSSGTLDFTTHAGNSGEYQVVYQVTGGQLLRTEGGATQEVGEGLVVTDEEFTHAANPGQRSELAIQLQVNFEDDNTPREVSTVIAGRNAWATC